VEPEPKSWSQRERSLRSTPFAPSKSYAETATDPSGMLSARIVAQGGAPAPSWLIAAPVMSKVAVPSKPVTWPTRLVPQSTD
jgi:hypothetical protein